MADRTYGAARGRRVDDGEERRQYAEPSSLLCSQLRDTINRQRSAGISADTIAASLYLLAREFAKTTR